MFRKHAFVEPFLLNMCVKLTLGTSLEQMLQIWDLISNKIYQIELDLQKYLPPQTHFFSVLF